MMISKSDARCICFFATLLLAVVAAPRVVCAQKPATDPLASACTTAADYSGSHSGRAVLVMHKGQIVFERYDNGWAADKPHPLASGTKSFTGVAAMFAVQDGLLTLDELAADTLIEWKQDPRKSRITIRHLLTLSSGLDPSDAELGGRGGSRLLGEGAANRAKRLDRENKPQARDNFAAALAVPAIAEPGAKFMYGPSHFYAFGELLERKLRASDTPQKTILAYMHARFLDPIGLKVAWFGKDAEGHPNLPGGCLLTAREWIKFGEFVRLNGAWKQPDGSLKSLLRPELLAECFKPSAANHSYGLTWWLRRASDQADGAPAPSGDDSGTLRDRLRERMQARRQNAQNRPLQTINGQPVEVFMAAGLGKQRLYILPAQDLVIVRFAESTREGQRFDDREFLEPIVQALAASSDKPAPAKQ